MPIEPQAGESEDQYMKRCISEETNAGMERNQAVAVCASKWGEYVDKGKKKDAVLRVDFAEAPRMRRTDEGYLTGEARVARIGIQNYRNGDGTIRRELRRPEDVFAADALASFRNVPSTYGHPDERLVTAENAKRLSVGFVGENIRVDGRWVVMPITITDADTISRIEAGETIQLSAGYTADVDEEAGEYDGEVYDAVQRNIRGNHVAIVAQARAGDEARLQLDAADAVAVNNETMQSARSDSMSEKQVTVRVDGIEYEVPPEVERHLAKQDEQVEALTGERDQAKADAETNKAKADEAQAELDKLKEQRSDEAIREAAKARVALERDAAKVLGDEAELDGKTDRQIQEEVVQKVHSDADLSEASDTYVQARYDAALATAKAHGDAMAKQRETAGATAPAGDGQDTPEAKRDAAMESIRSAWKRPEKQTH